MNTLAIFACLAVAAFAAPLDYSEPAPFDLTHTSNIDGSYAYTYSSEDSSKTESRDHTGAVRGAYSYVDDAGALQKVQYIADENGFQASGSNLPVESAVPVTPTPEVLEATAQHFALVEEHIQKLAVAQRLEAEYRAAHPEVFVDEHGVHHETHAQTHEVHQVHHVEVPVHYVEIPAHHYTHLPSVHFEAPVKQVHQEYAHHSTYEVPVQQEYVHQVQYVDEIPVAPEDDDDVKIAKAQHLAEVERLTQEHYAALAAAPPNHE